MKSQLLEKFLNQRKNLSIYEDNTESSVDIMTRPLGNFIFENLFDSTSIFHFYKA